MASNSKVKSHIRCKIELMQNIMAVLVTCKTGEDPFKIKALEWPQHFPL